MATRTVPAERMPTGSMTWSMGSGSMVSPGIAVTGPASAGGTAPEVPPSPPPEHALSVSAARTSANGMRQADIQALPVGGRKVREVREPGEAEAGDESEDCGGADACAIGDRGDGL
ncbi:hypothetical protein GCM10018791_59730 [Streptomyces zaomyceticus]|nr:hypothetical protein GCM10018791_59730 [Streptomyces zaomyceticus]